MTPGHPVGIGHPVVLQALPEILGLAHIEHPVGCVPHQIHPRLLGSLTKKPLAQLLVKRFRVGNEEQLAHGSPLFLYQTAGAIPAKLPVSAPKFCLPY
jgi:hypothetical protein